MHIHLSNKLRRPFAVMATVAVITATGIMAFTAGASATNSKVAVCHETGNGTYNLIVVSSNALSAHLGHGDGEPGDAVPTMTGWHFGDNCTPTVNTPTEPPLACYTLPGNDQLPAVDFFYNGPIDMLGNMTFYTSGDGSCTGGPYTPDNTGMIAAADETEAQAKCVALLANPFGGYVEDLTPISPALTGFWSCTG